MEKQIFMQANTLAQKINRTLLAKQEQEFEQLDKEIMEAKIKVERQCQTIKAGKYGWTPELNEAIQMVLYWKGIEKCQKGGKIGKDTLTGQAAQGGITHTQTHFELKPKMVTSNINQVINICNGYRPTKKEDNIGSAN